MSHNAIAFLCKRRTIRLESILHTVAIFNHKGGVGTTTITKTLGLELANKGKRVLLIDADSQASLTRRLDYTTDQYTYTLLEVLTTVRVDTRVGIKEARLKVRDTVDLVPSFVGLRLIDQHLERLLSEAISPQAIQAFEAEFFQRMRKALNEVADEYDYCIIDSASSVTDLTHVILQAATHCLIPTSTTIDDFEATWEAHELIEIAKEDGNSALENLGIVISSTSGLRNDRFYKDLLKQKYNVLIEIPRSKVVREAATQSPAVTVIEYNPRNKAARGYLRLTDILLGELERA